MAQRIFIIGVGRFGTHLATRLSQFGSQLVLADKNPDRVEDLVQDARYCRVTCYLWPDGGKLAPL